MLEKSKVGRKGEKRLGMDHGCKGSFTLAVNCSRQLCFCREKISYLCIDAGPLQNPQTAASSLNEPQELSAQWRGQIVVHFLTNITNNN